MKILNKVKTYIVYFITISVSMMFILTSVRYFSLSNSNEHTKLSDSIIIGNFVISNKNYND